MSLAAIPAYLLARRRAARPASSLLAALLAVALPSLVYTGTLMTENAFYPRSCSRRGRCCARSSEPTLRRQLVLLAACGVVTLVRVQALAVVAGGADRAAPAPPRRPQAAARRGFRCLRHRRRRRRARRSARSSRAAGRSRACSAPTQVVGEESYDVGDVLKYLLWHLAELDLYVGVIPFAAFLLLAARIRSLEPRVQAFARRDDLARRLDADRGRHVRLALRRPDRQERNMFFARAAAPDRRCSSGSIAARRDRASTLIAAALHRRRAAGADPVRALPAADGARLRHADARCRSGTSRTTSGCRGSTTSSLLGGHRRRRAASCFVPRRYAARAARARPRLLRRRAPADPGRARHGIEQAACGRALPGDPRRHRATGSTEPFRRPTTSRSLWTGQDRPLHGQHERVLQPPRRPGLLRSAGRCRAACPRRAVERRPGDRRRSARADGERRRGGLRARRRHGRARRRRRSPRDDARSASTSDGVERPARLDDDASDGLYPTTPGRARRVT